MVSERVGTLSESRGGTGARGVCPFCSCGCGLRLLHDGLHTVGSAPVLKHPVSQGRLCARGWASHEPPAWGARLLAPEIREGGERRRAGWDEALERAARELRALLEVGKAVGVLVSGRCTNEEAYLAAKLARGPLRTGHLDDPLGASYRALLAGLCPEGPPGEGGRALEAVEHSRQILLLEGDLSVTHPRAALAVLRAVRRGARLVTLGLARTPLSQVAAVHLSLDPLRPFALPPDLLGALGGGNGRPPEAPPTVLLAPFTSDPRIVAATVRALAEVLGSSGPDGGTGARFLPLPFRANTRGVLEGGVAPDRLPGGLALDDPQALARLRQVWGMDPWPRPGLDAAALLEQVRGLVVVGEDPPRSLPAPAKAREALKGLESLVVLDAYASATSDAATVVLPVAALQETEGTLTSLEGRIQGFGPAVPPPGRARPGWEVLFRLLELLGAPSGRAALGAVRAEMAEVVPGFRSLVGSSAEGEDMPAVARAGRTPEPDLRRAGAQGDGDAFGSHVLVLAGAFDWDDDLMVDASPTLRRDGASRRKLFPQGSVTMNPADARALGIRSGWSVRLRSRQGEAVVPVSLGTSVEPGVLLVPFAFREALSGVLGGEAAQRVEVERT